MAVGGGYCQQEKGGGGGNRGKEGDGGGFQPASHDAIWEFFPCSMWYWT
jgi:hypothetical protein